MRRKLDWARDGAAWPHHGASRFVDAGGLRWHVQCQGSGPVAVLVHGTGASVHSWRHLMPLLAERCTVVAMDLPGHAFTESPHARRLSLPAMAEAVAALIQTMNLRVDIVVGHSAGAAIAARMVLDGACTPRLLVALNGAFLPLAGLPGLVFPPVARALATTKLAPQWFAGRQWDRDAVMRLIGGTGSTLDEDGLSLYGALVRDPQHGAGALGMMARWDLRPLQADLRRLRTPLALIVGARDRAVPPADARRVQRLLPADTGSRLDVIAGAGHLVHEEAPVAVAQAIARAERQLQPTG